ncbi:MAG: 16S rRNA (cytidine(1402)-2'-O)-methyltransferase [bacterium]
MLTICPTPIGNLSDASERQREVLANADVIACEDTRVTGKLLELLGIARTDGIPRLWRLDDHNEESQVVSLLDAVREGKNVVLVSDAGTPCIADPGFRIVRAAAEAGISFDVLPGANAAIVALVASGLPIQSFVYAGFLPAKSAARQAEVIRHRKMGLTWVFYEAPHRLVDALSDVTDVCGPDQPVFVGRELTKLHQEYVHGPASNVLETFRSRDRVRGECVVVVGASAQTKDETVSLERLVKVLDDAGCSPQQVKAIASQLLGVAKSDAYSVLQSIKAQN